MDKTTKLSVCLGFALAGWILPASMPLPKPLQGISLGFALTATIAGATESKRENVRHKFAKTERDQEFEALATEQILRHEQRLKQLYTELGFGEDEYEGEYDDRPQPQLDGTTIHQPTIAPGDGGSSLWHIDRLLENNSSHVLLIGQTGSGKTTLARWLISQLNSDRTIVLDADDDGQTWQGFTIVGRGDDWEAIEGALQQALEDFKGRQPNGKNPQTVYILEELPDLISECATGTKFCSRILRRGRKRKMFVIGLTQDPNTSTIGLSQPVQKCFTRIYLGGMSQYALKNLVPRGDKPAIADALKGCQRPAIVEFLGQWYAWDVPSLSPSPSPAPAKPIVLTAEGDPTDTAILTRLNKCLAANVDVTLEHWAIVDFAKSHGGWVSAREAMRAISKIKTADQCKSMFRDLQALELGETSTDDRYPDRLLFKAY